MQNSDAAEMSVVSKFGPSASASPCVLLLKYWDRTLGSHLHWNLCCEVYLVKTIGWDLFICFKWLQMHCVLLSITRTVLQCPSLTSVTGKIGIVHRRLKPSGFLMYHQV